MAKRTFALARMLSSIGVLGPGGAKSIPGVEVLTDDREPMHVGAKRNALIAAAKGQYICFVDDDDTVTPDYVSSILSALQSRPDVVGIEGVISWADNTSQIFKHSVQFAGWYTGADDIYYRTPNHLNPVRREIAQRVGFASSLTIGEDVEYSQRLKQHLKTEEYIDHPIYNYDCTNHCCCQPRMIKSELP